MVLGNRSRAHGDRSATGGCVARVALCWNCDKVGSRKSRSSGAALDTSDPPVFSLRSRAANDDSWQRRVGVTGVSGRTVGSPRSRSRCALTLLGRRYGRCGRSPSSRGCAASDKGRRQPPGAARLARLDCRLPGHLRQGRSGRFVIEPPARQSRPAQQIGYLGAVFRSLRASGRCGLRLTAPSVVGYLHHPGR
jgi:hypothetical protein